MIKSGLYQDFNKFVLNILKAWMKIHKRKIQNQYLNNLSKNLMSIYKFQVKQKGKKQNIL